MKRKIFCVFFKEFLEGLQYINYPGKLGKKIYKHISQKAWNLWIKKQTILINEHKLDMKTLQDRKLVEKKMIAFLFKKNFK
ncbi:oxidative damage protection protein [bacterium endosymbiont of Pedicinus badii]|uniref:oxidative damage protection protein n=1 Tax=bacterium endosymbiont of Pedicinus badii TaxID=1719126 RepID=UPI0009BBAF44|nr:oxidative damage protection protein [bacterium endosymbiont of Pedicinus badii]OQM34025.1 hypothetical protein AOQ89_01535 [bacterium endosymbiont of Pedicinus badii]